MRTAITWIFLSLISFGAYAELSPKTEQEVYNNGVDLLLELKFRKAEKKFRKALEMNPEFGEAHNNLAYCLRKQGADNYPEALEHYNRAVELIPGTPEPYMYRGVLFVSMGDMEKAAADHERLTELGSSALADELQWVMEHRREKEPEQFFGVIQKVEE